MDPSADTFRPSSERTLNSSYDNPLRLFRSMYQDSEVGSPGLTLKPAKGLMITKNQT